MTLSPAEVRKLVKALGDMPLHEAALVEAAGEHSGAMVALIPTEVDAARLAVDGGEPANELHVTLAYLGDAADIPASVRQEIIDQVSSAVLGMAAVDATAFSVAAFNPAGDEPCLVYGISGDMVDAAHTLVSEAVWTASPKQHAPFCAHLTAAYTGDFGRLGELVERCGPVRFDRMRIAFAGQALDIPLVEPEADDGDIDEPDGPWFTEADDDRNSLKRWWVHGAGAKRWVGKKHPWSALYKALRTKLGSERAKRIASSFFHARFGYWPGDRRRKKVTESTRLLVEAAGADHPESCEKASLTSVCHCGCAGTRHGETLARTRLGSVQADRADREGRDVRLAAMDDDELAAQFARHSREGNWDAFNALVAEMDRREQAATWPDPAAAEDHWDTGGEPTEQDRQIDALLARGYDYADAFTEVFGGNADRIRSEERTSAVDRLDGETIDQAVRRSYDGWVHEQWIRAEADTGGHLLTPEAQAAGVDPVSLFSGPAHVARARASEDLQRWWADNGRMTFVEYRAQVLGRDSDRRAAELVRLGGNARDFL